MRTTQIAIIGGGPAGLQAAMSIGRVHREAVLFDSGEYRNSPVVHMHNVAGFDGTPPAEFRAQVREQLEPYDTVEVRSDAATSVTEDGDEFVIESAGAPVRAKSVILATGMRDVLPAIPGVDELWGNEVAQCPFCHGHEYAGKKIGLLGAAEAAHYAAMMHPVTDDLVALTNGAPMSEEAAAVLEALETPVRTEKVSAIERTDDGVRVSFETGDPVDLAGVFLLPGLEQRAPFAQQLGANMQDSGAVEVDEWRCTSVDGVFAAGDMAHTSAFPVPMASVIQSLASRQQAAITAIQYVMAHG